MQVSSTVRLLAHNYLALEGKGVGPERSHLYPIPDSRHPFEAQCLQSIATYSSEPRPLALLHLYNSCTAPSASRVSLL